MRKQIEILSTPIDVVNMQQAIDQVLKFIDEPGLHMIATANAEMIMMARENEELAKVLKNAALVVPDGAGALWAAEQQGKNFEERVAGLDLATNLMGEASKRHIPVYLLGAAPGVVEQAISNLKKRFGVIDVVGYHSGFFDEQEEIEIIKEITEKQPRIILVALGVPKQELWIAHKLQNMNNLVAIGVGGAFDVLAGNITRAPKWFQENRLEWLYRLYKQPSRFTRMLALPRFMYAVMKEKMER